MSMNAGTIGLLESAVDDRLDTWNHQGGFPAIEVRETQDRLGDTPIQAGVAATRVGDTEPEINVYENHIEITDQEVRVPVWTRWIADVTNSGLVIAESLTESSDPPFPFDIITTRTSQFVQRVNIQTEKLAEEWADRDDLRDTWMVAEGDPDSTVMRYGKAATEHGAADATTGVGFVTSWGGTVLKGVAYRSGYIAIWADIEAPTFIEFVNDEIMPFAFVPEDDEPGTQATLD